MNRTVLCLISALQLFSLSAFSSAPLDLARRVSDKVLATATLDLEYAIQSPYADAEAIDFARSCDALPGIAYALSTIQSDAAQETTFEVGSRAPLKIWIDNKLVFSRATSTDFQITYDEKSYALPEKFTVTLAKGEHTILVKTARADIAEPWQFVIQTMNMGRYGDKKKRISFHIKNHAPKAASLSHWLILGVFAGDIDTACPPETALEFHKIHTGANNRRIAWNIPRVNLLTANKNRTYSSWNYHIGCFNWALQNLARVTGDARYSDHANRWCDYALGTFPIVEHQMRDLLAFRSMNFGQVGLPMLDYISAPAIPYVTRLAAEGDNFPEASAYRAQAAYVVDYLRTKQYRVDGIFARSYTKHPSVWADDMYMGIPYLVQWAKYTRDPAERAALLDDASAQILTFNKHLFDPAAALYRQAAYPSHPEEKVPFWSRGNGWAIWATTEVLAALPDAHKNRPAIMRIYREHVDGLLRQQDPEGYWRNVLDIATSPRESSGAAIFTLCIARGINNGWLPREKYAQPLERAWRALATFVDDNNDFNGVKGGTNFSTNPDDYDRIGFVKSDTHGLLPFVFACIEMHRYLNAPPSP